MSFSLPESRYLQQDHQSTLGLQNPSLISLLVIQGIHRPKDSRSLNQQFRGIFAHLPRFSSINQKKRHLYLNREEKTVARHWYALSFQHLGAFLDSNIIYQLEISTYPLQLYHDPVCEFD